MRSHAALVLMFVFGAVSGAALILYFRPPFFEPPPPRDMKEHMISFLTRQLDLTPDQQEKIKPIAADFATEAETLHTESIDHFAELATETDSRIASILRPDQQAKLEKMAQERDKMFREHGGPAGP